MNMRDTKEFLMKNSRKWKICKRKHMLYSEVNMAMVKNVRLN